MLLTRVRAAALIVVTAVLTGFGQQSSPVNRQWPPDVQKVSPESPALSPADALQTGQDGAFVFVIKPDLTVSARPVVVDRTMGDDAVIQSGLAAGERVVTSGQLRLAEGTRVEIRKPPPAGKPGAQQ